MTSLISDAMQLTVTMSSVENSGSSEFNNVECLFKLTAFRSAKTLNQKNIWRLLPFLLSFMEGNAENFKRFSMYSRPI